MISTVGKAEMLSELVWDTGSKYLQKALVFWKAVEEYVYAVEVFWDTGKEYLGRKMLSGRQQHG